MQVNSSLVSLVLTLFVLSNTHFSLVGQQKYTSDPSIMKDPTGYKLRTGDRVRIIVRGEPDANVDTGLSNYGGVRPAYVDEVRVAGLNVDQAAAEIARQYQRQDIYERPKVSVVVTKYSEKMVFLSGAVNKKGPFVLPPEVEAMTITEVIARSGGFTDIAKKSKVYVTRTFYNNTGEATNTKTYEVNVDALTKGTLSSGSAKLFWIYPGDRIQVPERLI
jgi:protein involved in polysaccharide export with SLBB domain